MSVKAKLGLILGMVFVSLVGFIITLNIIISELKDFSKMELLDKNLETGLLELRKNEKDFMLRLETKYIDSFNKTTEQIFQNFNELNQLLEDYNIKIDSIEKYKESIAKYKNYFEIYQYGLPYVNSFSHTLMASPDFYFQIYLKNVCALLVQQ